MKKAILLSAMICILTNAYAQNGMQLLGKKPDAAISTNETLLTQIGDAYHLVYFDTSGDRYLQFGFKNATGQRLDVSYKLLAIGKDVDLGKPGELAISTIAVEGPFLSLFQLYKGLVDVGADMTAIKNAGQMPYAVNNKIKGRVRFYRREDDKGIWLLELAQ